MLRVLVDAIHDRLAQAVDTPAVDRLATANAFWCHPVAYQHRGAAVAVAIINDAFQNRQVFRLDGVNLVNAEERNALEGGQTRLLVVAGNGRQEVKGADVNAGVVAFG